MSDDSNIINKKEKLLLEMLTSNRDVFIQAYSILKPEYFEEPLDKVVKFVLGYFSEYHALPDHDIIEAETSIAFKNRHVDDSETQYVLDEVEEHCQRSAAEIAILDSVDLVQGGRIGEVLQRMKEVVTISLDKKVGTDLFEDPEIRIEMTGIGVDERNIGIPALDELMGQIRRGELSIFSAGTSVGKSVMLGNIACLLAKQKLDVLIVSVEMNEDMYSKRLDSLVTGIPLSKEPNAQDIASALGDLKDDYGRIITKRVNNRFGLEDLRALVMEYHLKYGKYPDSLLIDYIDIFSNGSMPKGINGKHEWDEVKTHAIRDIMDEFGMYGFTASQLNRDSYGVTDIGVQHIAGGLSKAAGSDNVIGIVETEEDKENDSWTVIPLKLRNQGKNHDGIKLYRCPKTLRISDKGMGSGNVTHTSPIKKKAESKKKDKEEEKETLTTGKGKDKLRAALKL